MMKREKLFCVVLISCSLGMSSCRIEKPPIVEVCIFNSKDFFCVDDRMNPKEYSKRYESNIGYLCTSATNYEKLVRHCDNLRTRLIQCESSRN